MQMDIYDVVELAALAGMDVEAGRLDKALEKLKVANQRTDRTPEIDAQLARIYAQLRLYAKSIEHFKRFLNVQPSAELERFQLGMVYFDTADFPAAIKIWDGVLSHNPAHPPALFYRASARLKQDQLEEARRDLDVLLKSVATNNLYFGRGKELLEALDEHQRNQRRIDVGQPTRDQVYKPDPKS